MSEVYVHSVGTFLGTKVITAAQVEEKFGKERGYIEKVCGVTQLHRFENNQTTTTASVAALNIALQRAGITKNELNGIYASSNPTGETLIPGLARNVGAAIGLRSRGPQLTGGMGCTGALQALVCAYNQLIVDSINCRSRTYAVISSDATSKMLDNNLWSTAPLFSEGAAALIVSNSLHPIFSSNPKQGAYVIEQAGIGTITDENFAHDALRLRNPYHLPLDANLSANAIPLMEMDGRALKKIMPVVLDVVCNHILDINMIKSHYIVPHQPNSRMLEDMIQSNNLDPNRVYVDGIKTIGNTSGPALFLGLEDAVQRNLIPDNSGVVLMGFGAELAVGAAYLKPSTILTKLNPRSMLGE